VGDLGHLRIAKLPSYHDKRREISADACFLLSAIDSFSFRVCFFMFLMGSLRNFVLLFFISIEVW